MDHVKICQTRTPVVNWIQWRTGNHCSNIRYQHISTIAIVKPIIAYAYLLILYTSSCHPYLLAEEGIPPVPSAWLSSEVLRVGRRWRIRGKKTRLNISKWTKSWKSRTCSYWNPWIETTSMLTYQMLYIYIYIDSVVFFVWYFFLMNQQIWIWDCEHDWHTVNTHVSGKCAKHRVAIGPPKAIPIIVHTVHTWSLFAQSCLRYMQETKLAIPLALP